MNSTTLLATLTDLGASAVDLGLVADDREALRGALVAALATCDIVISSGGVSMGSADHIKPLLEELGTVHFGRLNMKPGKPTTFATVPVPEEVGAASSKSDFSGHSEPRIRLVFGVPGNPVSSIFSLRRMVPTLN